MKKGFKNFCNGDGSTSTLNQQNIDHGRGESSCMAYLEDDMARGSQPTLEEMILRLDLEEKMARRAKLDEYAEVHHRMSCVNSSDILRSARNALNQYPRFSLDGKDAMYRSSFRNFDQVNTGARKSVGHERRVRKGNLESHKSRCLPAKVAGESVVWCKPGVVGKLMGLEAMPVPLNSHCRKDRLINSIARKQNLRRRAERQEMAGGCGGRKGGEVGSCSTTRYCVMKPVVVEIANDEAGWPMRRFL